MNPTFDLLVASETNRLSRESALTRALSTWGWLLVAAGQRDGIALRGSTASRRRVALEVAGLIPLTPITLSRLATDLDITDLDALARFAATLAPEHRGRPRRDIWRAWLPMASETLGLLLAERTQVVDEVEEAAA